MSNQDKSSAESADQNNGTSSGEVAPPVQVGPSAETHKEQLRQTWAVPPGGVITTAGGYLRRTRPDTYHHKWSKVSVGPVAAQELSQGLNERDHMILLFAEHMGVVTIEQISRIFFESQVTARKRVRLLRARRFLASPEADPRTLSAAVGHRAETHNAPLVLDWNGKYLLENMHHDLRTWEPATVAQVNSQFGHTLAVSELWSYLAAAACATHEDAYKPRRASLYGKDRGEDIAPEQSSAAVGSTGEPARRRGRFAVGVLNEWESIVYYQGRTGWSLDLEWAEAGTAKESGSGAGAGDRKQWAKRRKYRVLLRPDATFVFPITPGKVEQAKRGANSWLTTNRPAKYWGSWFDSLLVTVPSPSAMRIEERASETRFKQAFVEMETGSNSSRDLIQKIGRYNQLYSRLTGGDMMHGQSWQTLFNGTFPTIIVAVPDQSQLARQVGLWRTHFAAKSPGAVILTTLEVLAQGYAAGRAKLVTARLWLDVMRPGGPTWRSLSDIFDLGS